MFNTIKAILAVAALLLSIGMLGACGGGGGGSAAPATPAPPTYRVEYASVIFAPDTGANLVTITMSEGSRILRRSDGVSIGVFEELTIVTPGGDFGFTASPAQIGSYQFTLNESWRDTNGVSVGAAVSETVYVADFQSHRCSSIRGQAYRGASNAIRRQVIFCRDAQSVTIASMTVFKAARQIYRVCWRDNRARVTCDLRQDNTRHFIGLAFPDQTYRRDDGKCESAPFYAVGNCQGENAVDVGNFAAFVSGLDGGGYRQFGVRHRWNGEGWNAAAMVSNAKGAEFVDTWWGRLRLEHSIVGDAAAFGEYESGITSLRQNGFMFADIPISGGRVGFRFDDFMASFGRPMHYRGKGKNAAAVHWQHNKESALSFRTHNNNAEVLWQWQRRF